MLWLIYNSLLYFYAFITLPFYLYKFFSTAKYRHGLKERLGFVPIQEKRHTILIHTVSVGEFLASLPLIKAVETNLPDYKLVISTTTRTGNKIAKQKINVPERVVYFPLDFAGPVNRFLDRISPDIVVLVETELWPNFLMSCRRKGIPVVTANGRISRHSFLYYLRLKGIFNRICKNIQFWGVQFDIDKERLEKLGIDGRNIKITGSLKFDSAIQQAGNLTEIDDIKKYWGWSPEVSVIVGGSTHKGEEKILLDIYQALKNRFKDLVLILVPRHLERINKLKTLINSYNLKYILRSNWQVNTHIQQYQVVLVDTMGELFSIYSLADVVFIGKSICRKGGQNPIEPAVLGRAVICGPFMGNFIQITKWFVGNRGIIQVRNALELAGAVKDILDNPDKRRRLGMRARELVEKASGASRRNMDILKAALLQTGAYMETDKHR